MSGAASMNDGTTSTDERRADVLRRYRPLSALTPIRARDVVLVERLIPKGLTRIASPPRTGKSTLLTEIAVGVASGSPVLGRYAVAKESIGHVVYVVGEGQLGSYRARADQIVSARGLRSEVLNNIHVRDARDLLLGDHVRSAELVEVIEVLRPSLIVLDPVSALRSGDRGSTSTMQGAYDEVEQVIATFGVSFIVTQYTSATSPSSQATGSLGPNADGYLTLARGSHPNEVILRGEYRDAAPLDPVVLRRMGETSNVTRFFEFTAEAQPSASGERRGVPDVAAAVKAALAKAAGQPMTVKKLAREVGRKDDVVGKTLRALKDSGAVICRGRGRWVLSVPVPGLDDCWNGNGPEPEMWDG